MAIADLTRIKIALADPAGTLLRAATGDLVSYSDLLDDAGSVANAVRIGAGYIAAYLAQQPVSVGSGGESVAWATERIAFYDRLSKGHGGGASGAAAFAPTPAATTRAADFTTEMD